MANLLDDFTQYIENLCKKHTEILHNPEEEKNHFVELSSDHMMTNLKSLLFPFITIDKVSITYTGLEDGISKNRYVEMMFLDSLSSEREKLLKINPDDKTSDFVIIQNIKNRMERIAEEFIMKMKLDRKDRSKYPFLVKLSLNNFEINYLENVVVKSYGVLLSFDFSLPFTGCIQPGRFTE